MRFVLTADVTPESPFGLPEGDVLVVPAPTAQMFGPAFHSRAGVRVGYGTLSRYRALESRLDVAMAYGTLHVRFVDNAMELRFEAPDRSSALEVGQAHLDKFLQHFALEHGRPFNATPRILEDETGTLVPLPITLWRGTVTVYDLDALREQLQAAATRATVDDAPLAKALDYYEHALFLSHAVPSSLPVSMRTVDHLLAAAFLFLWKALSAVVGDPSSDRDYQRRYRDLGLDYAFFHDTIEEIRRLRNEEDVAHYRIDSGGLDALKGKLDMAKEAAKRVIVAYSDRLQAGPPER